MIYAKQTFKLSSLWSNLLTRPPLELKNGNELSSTSIGLKKHATQPQVHLGLKTVLSFKEFPFSR